MHEFRRRFFFFNITLFREPFLKDDRPSKGMRRISLERTNINCFEKRRRSMKLREQFSRVLKSLEDRRNEAEHGIREREKPVSRIILSLSFTQSLDSRDQEIFRTLEISRRAGIKKQGGRGGEKVAKRVQTRQKCRNADATRLQPSPRGESRERTRCERTHGFQDLSARDSRAGASQLCKAAHSRELANL